MEDDICKKRRILVQQKKIKSYISTIFNYDVVSKVSEFILFVMPLE